MDGLTGFNKFGRYFHIKRALNEKGLLAVIVDLGRTCSELVTMVGLALPILLYGA